MIGIADLARAEIDLAAGALPARDAPTRCTRGVTPAPAPCATTAGLAGEVLFRRPTVPRTAQSRNEALVA